MIILKKLFTPILTIFLIGQITFLKAQHAAVLPPVEYIENQGQWQGPFDFKGQTSKGDIYLRKNGFTVMLADGANHAKTEMIHHGKTAVPQVLKYHAYEMNFLNCRPNIQPTTEKLQKHYYNYFFGSVQSKWKTNIHPALAVNYTDLYTNIDAHVYSEKAEIKYDLIVKPGGKVSDIHIEYKGTDGLYLKNNKLYIGTSLGEVTELSPYTYQFIDGIKKEVSCSYVVKGNVLSFNVGKDYDKSQTLYIDPTLKFCSFTASTADNWGYTATYDAAGNFYAGGIAGGIGYPATVGAIQTTYHGGITGSGGGYACDASFSKFVSDGTALIYATYFGGTDNDQPQSMIVDYAGNLVIAGRTYSNPVPALNGFPVTTGCYDATYAGLGDMFVSKFDPTGTVLMGSTYVGGSNEDASNIFALETQIGGLKHNYADDARSEVVVDSNNNIYVAACTKSVDFPTVNPYQAALAGQQDAVVIELNSSLTNLLWSTYIGGTNDDAAYVISFNKKNQGQVFIAGGTEGGGFPSTPSTLHTSYQGGSADGFVLKFNSVTKALLAGTYIGTNDYDQVFGIQTDTSNNVYIVGQTQGAYPVTPGVLSYPNSSQFITKLNNNLSNIIYSTVFGTGTTTTTDIAINAFLVDICENVYVSGWGGPIIPGNTGSTTNLPTTTGAIQTTTDGSDFYFIVFSKDLVPPLLYGSFYGQFGGGGEHVDGGTSRFDANGVIYQAICAGCGGGNIPTTPGVYGPTNLSTNCNLAALKIEFNLVDPNADAQAAGDTVICLGETIQFVNNSSGSTGFQWDFGDGTPVSTLTAPTHTYTTAGTYIVTLTAFNPNGCSVSQDIDQMVVVVKDDSIASNFTYVKIDSCGPKFSAQFTNTSTNTGPGVGTIYQWDFGDGTSFTGTTPNPNPHFFPSQGIYTVTLTMTDPEACNTPSVFTQVIDFNVVLVTAEFNMPDSICLPALVNFTDQSTNATTYSWAFGDGQTSTAINPSNTYTSPGTYTVFLVAGNPNTCNKKDTSIQTISVFPSPVADFIWSPDPPVPNTANVFTNISTGATRYLWDFGDGATSIEKNETHVFQKDGYYNVCLSAWNDYGCIDTTCKRVRGIVVPLVDVPSGFSPNGDGINDYVYVKGYGILTMVFKIYNRWGEKVFESRNQSIGWDGRYKDVIQEMEVYGYTLEVTFFDGTKDSKKGNITLLK